MNRKLLIALAFSFSIWSPSLWAASFQVAGMIDNDMVLVDDDTVEPFKGGAKMTEFLWAMPNTKAEKYIDGNKYDSVVEKVIVDCEKPNARAVLTRWYEFRDLNSKREQRPKSIDIKTENFTKATGSQRSAPMVSTERLSPAGIAVGYACALAQSRTFGTPMRYRMPSKSAPDAKQLICEFPDAGGRQLELNVSFDGEDQLAIVQHSAFSTATVNDQQIVIDIRDAYGLPPTGQLVISRTTGKATLEEVLTGECRPRGVNKF